MKRYTFIYALYSPEQPNVVRYVGKSNNINSRLTKHIYEAKNGKSYKNNWIKSLLNKGQKPTIKVLKKVDVSEWKYWEMFFVEKYKSESLTNATLGGDGGLTEDRYLEISHKKWKMVAQINIKYGNIINKFLNISDAASYIGAKSRSRISDCCNEKIISSYGFIWRFLGKDGNIIENKKRKTDIHRRKKIVQINIETGAIIKRYSSITEAARENNFDVANLSSCCLGKLNSSYGYLWRFIDDGGDISLAKHKPDKRVVMIDSNGNSIKIFLNATKAAEHVNLKQGDTIIKSCRDSKYSAAGYKWKFYSDINSEKGML